MAGLAAARALHNKGWRVTVLEARDRIGGRIKTSRRWPELPIDLGASWIHGAAPPLVTLARESATALLPDTSPYWYIHHQGRWLGPAQAQQIERFRHRLDRLIDAHWTPHQSVGAFVRSILRSEPLTHAQKQWLKFLVHNEIEQNAATDANALSMSYFEDIIGFEGEDLLVKDGYDRLLQPLKGGLDIRLEEPAHTITYDHHGASITTSRNTYHAQVALITLPIGVLQSQSVRFDPPLPTAKQRAIHALHPGLMNKLVLRFPHAFWQQDAAWISEMADDQDFTTWFSLHTALGAPILVNFQVGTFARHVEQRPDAQLIRQAMIALRRLYGSQIPDPIAWQRTRWMVDPWAQCAYASPGLDAHHQTRAALSAPVRNRLFFAGEATSERHASMVHGAYLSGLREAQRLSLRLA